MIIINGAPRITDNKVVEIKIISLLIFQCMKFLYSFNISILIDLINFKVSFIYKFYSKYYYSWLILIKKIVFAIENKKNKIV